MNLQESLNTANWLSSTTHIGTAEGSLRNIGGSSLSFPDRAGQE